MYRRGKGSGILDKCFGGVGRIRGPSGTSDPKTYARMVGMLDELYNRGRPDILKAIKQYFETRHHAGLAPMIVFRAYCDEGLSSLPTAAGLEPLIQSMLDWIDVHDVSDTYKKTMRSCVRHIARVGNSHSPISDLPDIIGQLKMQMRDKPRMFAMVRSTALGFLRAKFRRHHSLWNDVAGIDPLIVRNKRPHYPKTPEEMRTITSRMHPNYANIAWSMASTGMGPKEYWIDGWKVEGDRVRIYGKKRDGRDRFVPLIKGVPLVKPIGSLKAFRLALGSADFGRMGVYDLRRSYATWLEAAAIPRTRRKLYLGHGARTVTDLYEWVDVNEFIAGDSRKLTQHVNPEAIPMAVAQSMKPRFELMS